MTLTDDDFNAEAPRVPLEPLLRRDPRELGQYRLLGRLGSGGMGVAFLAERPGGWAVVKLLKDDVADDPRRRRWIARELEAMRLAAGPHTAELLEEHTDEDPAWFAMEFVPGLTLHRRVTESGPMERAELVSFANQLKDALTHIHSNGLVHRDLKPTNIILTPQGPRLIDFGIAYVPGATQWTSGAVIGTLGWLAPEQIQGASASTATDVYAWALCVIFAATGRPPFGQPSEPMEGYRPFLQEPTIPEELPEHLRAEVKKALSIDPAMRPDWQRDIPIGATLVDATLEQSQETEPILQGVQRESRPSRSRGRTLAWGLAILLLLSAATGAAFALLTLAGTDSVAPPPPPSSTTSSPSSTSTPSLPTPSAPVVTPIVDLPPAPTGLKVRSRDRSLLVTWDAVPGVTEYLITLTSAGGITQQVRVLDATNRVVKDLVNDRRYEVAVAGVSADGAGPYSSPKRVAPRPKPQPTPQPQPTTNNSGGSSGGNGGNTGGGEVVIVPEPAPTEIEPVS
jgi:serine/threonine protein kinase